MFFISNVVLEVFTLAAEAELYGQKSTFVNLKPISEKPEGKSTLYIYDYNDDTRAYIYENIIEGQTVVVYAPHEQDF